MKLDLIKFIMCTVIGLGGFSYEFFNESLS